VADLLRAEGIDRRRRGKDRRAREESGELRTERATVPPPKAGSSVETRCPPVTRTHRSPNKSQPLDHRERITNEISRETEFASKPRSKRRTTRKDRLKAEPKARPAVAGDPPHAVLLLVGLSTYSKPCPEDDDG